jgi:hypothetical protein
MRLGDCENLAASGGVLQASPRHIEGTSAVHVRVYLELWASVISGTHVDFRSFPSFSLDPSKGADSGD